MEPSRPHPLLAKFKPHALRVWHLLIKAIMPTLTIVALALSIYQLKQTKKAEEQSEKAKQEVESIAQNYRKIAASVSTQYENVFPANMKAITELIARTNKNITIVVDVAAYGHFSSPIASQEYVQALKTLSGKNIAINMVCYDSETSKTYLRKQLHKDNFSTFQESDRFKNYASRHANNIPTSFEKLLDQIDDADIALLDDLWDSGATVKTTKIELPVYMWIIDDNKEAVFSFYNYGQSPREASFRTQDERFIDVLKEMAKKAFDEGQPYEPKRKPS